MRDEADLPTSITIRSDDLPDVNLPAFFRHIPVEAVIDSASWSGDDPKALRARGPLAVGQAFLRMALASQTDVHQDVRELAALLIEHFGGDLRSEDLEAALGLRRRDGGPGLDIQARRAERDALLLGLARTAYPDLGPWAAAASIRKAIADYEGRRWSRERHRTSAPADA